MTTQDEPSAADNLAKLLDLYESEIAVFWHGGDDPRGPSMKNPYGRREWPTEPLWRLGRTTRAIAKHAATAGLTDLSERAEAIVRDLEGRCQSPEELAAFSEATRANAHEPDPTGELP